MSVGHPEGQHKSNFIHHFYDLYENFGLSDHKLGAILLAFASFGRVMLSYIFRTLSINLGGSKRLNALNTILSLIYIAPLFALNYIFNLQVEVGGNLLGLNTAPSSESVSWHVKHTLAGIFKESASRKIFAFLCLNLGFTFVELIYGVWTNSLGLISDGFHMFFDCAALVMGLYASVVGHWNPDKTFTFGYHRTEILSGFINSLFLIIISISIFLKAISRVFYPPEIITDRLLVSLI
ncbi:hypothetical protein Ciccas_012955 [Cichlidogyrus casuarinus]|uniref:Proton-coupled zinc antiporter SLC30A5 n=1 Tax=Cichlidogyrus casuarinus TaxID=1844966 RepID=A0ABD2PMK9_9PLAT